MAFNRNKAVFSIGLAIYRKYSNTRILARLPIRMGIFNSNPKILNDDIQDSDVSLPPTISRQELIQFCQTHPTAQAMVKRSFRKSQNCDQDYGFKFRKLNTMSNVCSDYESSAHNLRVFQWNILSQALGQMMDHFPQCPDKALEWSFRRYRIIEEIIEYSPDIICLQEVDHFNFLKHVLSTQGYEGLFYPKPDSPCFYLQGNNGPDGCAIFYRKNKFKLVNAETRILKMWGIESNQVALLAILRISETGKEICVTTTHLKARNGSLPATLRNEQGKDLLAFVDQHCLNRPTIMCGDFNAEPSEPIYDTILTTSEMHGNSKFGSAYADCDITGDNENHQHNDSGKSAQREPPYTTWKIRDEGEICHTIDYVFYSKSHLEIDGVLEFPTEKDIGPNRVPSLIYPSDHFSLVCDFRIVYQNTCKY